MPIFNDLNLDDWKESEIWTDSLWIIPRETKQETWRFLSRQFCSTNPSSINFTIHKENDVVFDPFVGSGTTAYEAENLGRHFVGVDIQPELIEHIKSRVDNKDYFSELILAIAPIKLLFLM